MNGGLCRGEDRCGGRDTPRLPPSTAIFTICTLHQPTQRGPRTSQTPDAADQALFGNAVFLEQEMCNTPRSHLPTRCAALRVTWVRGDRSAATIRGTSPLVSRLHDGRHLLRPIPALPLPPPQSSSSSSSDTQPAAASSRARSWPPAAEAARAAAPGRPALLISHSSRKRKSSAE